MAKLIAEMAAERAGEVCCGEMIRRGYSPTAMRVQRGGHAVLIILDVVRNDEGWGWTRGFILENGQIDPDVLQRDFEAWKVQIRAGWQNGKPVEQVRQAIQRFGAKAVEDALAPCAGSA